MLIEQRVFNFQEVDERSIADIKNECLVHFATRLKELLEADKGTEEVQVDWDKPAANKKVKVSGRNWGIHNYGYFEECFSNRIKYNTKSIVFEETLYNQEPWSVKDTCRAVYGLEWVEGTDECSGYYRYRKGVTEVLTHPRVCDQCACVSETKTDLQLENVRNFDKFFGLGEFPYMTIHLIRLGNKEHYFYTIHR